MAVNLLGDVRIALFASIGSVTLMDRAQGMLAVAGGSALALPQASDAHANHRPFAFTREKSLVRTQPAHRSADYPADNGRPEIPWHVR